MAANGERSYAATSVERGASDSGDVLGNDNGCQPRAVIEEIGSHRAYGGRNSDACQTGHAVAQTVGNDLHIVAESEGCDLCPYIIERCVSE